MATATKTSTKRKSGSRSSNGRASTKRSGATSKSKSKTTSRSNSTRKPSNGSAPSKGRWSQIADKASKARVPLIAGGTAIASAAAGAAAHKFAESRSGANGKLGRLTSKLPSPGKLDAGKVKSAGERLSALGQQTADIAAAVEKTRKKH